MQCLKLKELVYLDENLKEILQFNHCEDFIKFDDKDYSGKSHFVALFLGRFLKEFIKLQPTKKDESKEKGIIINKFSTLIEKYGINRFKEFEEVLMKNGGDGVLINKAKKANNIILSLNKLGYEELIKIIAKFNDPIFFEEELKETCSCIIEVTQGTCKRHRFKSYALEPEIILLRYIPKGNYGFLGHTLLGINMSLDPIMEKKKEIVFSIEPKEKALSSIYSILSNKKTEINAIVPKESLTEGIANVPKESLKEGIANLNMYIDNAKLLLVNLLRGQRLWKEQNLDSMKLLARSTFELISSEPELHPILYQSYKHQLIKFQRQLSEISTQIFRIQGSLKKMKPDDCKICKDCIKTIENFQKIPYYKNVLCKDCRHKTLNLEYLASLLCENFQLYLDILQNSEKNDNCTICRNKKDKMVYKCAGNHQICKTCSDNFSKIEKGSCPIIGCGKKIPIPEPPPEQNLINLEEQKKIPQRFQKALIKGYAKGYIRTNYKSRVLSKWKQNILMQLYLSPVGI